MRFGLYFELQTPPGKDHAQVYREAIQQVEAGDALGFDVVSMVEHHGQEQFSISANPLAFFTAAAQRTKRIRFRTALHTLALHHPLQLAGQIAAADILTGGRLECGLGRGHPWNFLSAGVPMEESRERFEEALQVLELAFSEPAVNFEGRFHSYRNQVVVPKPLQKPHPKFYMKVGDPRTAQRGWGVLVPPVYPHAEVAERLATYARDATAHGHVPDIVYLRAVYMDEDPAQARREAGEALKNFLAYNASPVATLPGKEELEKKGYGFYATGMLERLARMSVDEIIEREIAFVGTPEQVTEQIARIKAVPGIGELCVIANFGGIAHWKAMKTMELLAEQVMPALR
jgi:alkanesulfonate monooxygenase SsuD/methylene tetrahydromethanopterin reductase-like flavin-dependent oxidoreductase (luciferase family)